MINPLYWLSAQIEWPIKVISSRMVQESVQADVMTMDTEELIHEYNTAAYEVSETEITFRLRYSRACRLVAILAELQRRGCDVSD